MTSSKLELGGGYLVQIGMHDQRGRAVGLRVQRQVERQPRAPTCAARRASRAPRAVIASTAWHAWTTAASSRARRWWRTTAAPRWQVIDTRGATGESCTHRADCQLGHACIDDVCVSEDALPDGHAAERARRPRRVVPGAQRLPGRAWPASTSCAPRATSRSTRRPSSASACNAKRTTTAAARSSRR